MTPKEKAEELYFKMYDIYGYDDYRLRAKQCALIAVEAILFSNNTIFETNIPHECWKYWIEVKQELYKL
jgi:hypothetical protein